MATRRAFILAGTGSGCGKTTVTLGLLSLLQQRGMRVTLKVGPDYLDTAWHTAISGIASRNLDNFMLPAPILNALFTEQLQQADIAVIEGVMGLYDGYGTDPNYCSSAAMAKQLGCPVILLVDGKAVSTSIAATVMGFQHFDPGSRHRWRYRRSGQQRRALPAAEKRMTLSGASARLCAARGRRGAARTTSGTGDRPRVGGQSAGMADFASLLGRTLDIDRLLALSELAAMPIGEWGEQLAADAGEGLTLALADDEAFNFYYPDNLALLARCGVKMVRFSPLRDRQLPACQVILAGGGYPELHAAGLSANHSVAQLRAAHRRGVAIYAECGGLMYLGTTLEVTSGERYTMADILPGHSRMGTRLTRFGYCEAQAQQQTLLAAPGEWLRGHEFHYSDFSPATPAVLACRKQRDGKTLPAVAGRMAVRQRLCRLSAMSILPSVPPCSTTGCGRRGGRYDPSRLVCSLDT